MATPPRIDQPKPGTYALRLVKGGPPVAVRLALVDGHWLITVNGEPKHRDVHDIWPMICGKPIKQAEYEFLLKRAGWAREHDREHPAANPNRPVDLAKLKPGW